MQALISKLQFHYFEKGDFDEIESRSLEDTLLFIHNFPWEEQRNEIFVNLNGPSVTIENGRDAFLKIGVYYNGKFILYYLTESNKIYCRIVDRLRDLDKNVEDFFKDRTSETDFNKYRNGIYRRRKHFRTDKFEYRVSLWRISQVMMLPTMMSLTLLIGFIASGKLPPMTVAFMLTLFFIFFSGIHWLLLLNYYFFSRNLYLKISRGVDEFYFGKNGNIAKYNKKDIRTVRTYNNQGHRNPWSAFYTYEIEMRYGEVLQLTNLIIGSFAIGEKFPEVIINNKHKSFPFTRKIKIKTI